MFVSPPQARDVVQGLKLIPEESANLFYEVSWGVDAVKGYLTAANAFKLSQNNPVALDNKERSRDGGATIFQNNIYANQYFYFRRFKLGDDESKPSTHELSRTQPWLQWNELEKKYILKKGSPNETLLSPYVKNGKIKLFRGISENEARVFDRARDDENAESISQLFDKKRDSILFSPIERVAVNWSDGYVVEIEIDSQLLNNLDNTYVGVEHYYVELAIMNPDILKKSISTVILHRTGTP